MVIQNNANEAQNKGSGKYTKVILIQNYINMTNDHNKST